MLHPIFLRAGWDNPNIEAIDKAMVKKGGDRMSKNISIKPKKSANERFGLKMDKIISTLIQMKPIADTKERKDFVYDKLSEFLLYQKSNEQVG